MNHFAKIAAQLESRDLDGMLLTHEANRFYASGFHSAGTDGMALVTRREVLLLHRLPVHRGRPAACAGCGGPGGRPRPGLFRPARWRPSSATASSAWGLRTPI